MTRALTCDEIVHQCCRDAKDAHQEVTDGQIEDEEVDDRPHVPVLHHDEAHQDVPHHAQQEDWKISQHKAGRHVQGVLVIRIEGDVGCTRICADVNSSYGAGPLQLQTFWPLAGFHSLHSPSEPVKRRALKNYYYYTQI